jgi:hypothetical protein
LCLYLPICPKTSIHEKLCNLHTFIFFRYQCYLVYLILYLPSSFFGHLNLRKLDENGNHLPLDKWTITTINTKDGFKEFVYNFLFHTHIILYGNPPARILHEFQNILQLCPNT